MIDTDAMTYLPDDILVKVDRAAMSASLEDKSAPAGPSCGRVCVASADRDQISGRSDEMAAEAGSPQVRPEHVVHRSKMGFGVPIDKWLRGPLRDWAENLLSEDRLRAEGFFDPVPIRQRWHQHLANIRDRHYALWAILMFQAWYERLKA